MYRDEILAIGEAVIEAYAKGEKEQRSDLGPRISQLETAIDVLLPSVRATARAEQVLRPMQLPEDPIEQAVILNALLSEANGRLKALRSDSEAALSRCGLRYMKRYNFEEDVPF